MSSNVGFGCKQNQKQEALHTAIAADTIYTLACLQVHLSTGGVVSENLICTRPTQSIDLTLSRHWPSSPIQPVTPVYQVAPKCEAQQLSDDIGRCIDNNKPEIYVMDSSSIETIWRELKRVMGLAETEIDELWESFKSPSQIGAAYYSAAADTFLLGKIVKDLNRGGALKAVLKSYSKGKYVILRGYPGLRRIFNGVRYLNTNPQIVKMGIGKLGAQKLIKAGGILTIALLTVQNVADYVIRDDATLSQLIGGLAVDITKAAIGAGIGFAAGTVAAGMTTLALGPMAVAIAVGIGTAVLLDWLDTKYDIKAKVIEAVEYISEWFSSFLEKPTAVVILTDEQLRNERRGYFENTSRQHLNRRARTAYRY